MLIVFIEDIQLLLLFVNQSAYKSGRVIRITKVESKHCPVTLLLGNSSVIKLFFPPVFIYSTLSDTPISVTLYPMTLWFMLLHPFK
ncbi:hypothetical protein D3C76_1754390 [compost metagenome]